MKLPGGYQSTKVRALLKDLMRVKDSNDILQSFEQPTKCLVFSQWTELLNLIQVLTHLTYKHRVVYLSYYIFKGGT
jgi:hypothetical protein